MSFEDDQLARWLSMTETRAKRTVAQAVNSKAKEGHCLICGCQVGQQGRRGLCNKHYLIFYRTKMSKPKRERVKFEEEQIREGRILAINQIREIRTPNPFTQESA